MPSKPILLLLGIGPRTGTFIATKFADANYHIATAARSLKDGLQDNGYLNIKADLGDPNVVPKVFSKVKTHFGASPNVIIYNGIAPEVEPVVQLYTR